MFACVGPWFRDLSMVAREQEADGRALPGPRCRVRYQLIADQQSARSDGEN